MSSTITYCPACGRSVESEPGALCPQCRTSSPSSALWPTEASDPPSASEPSGWPPVAEPIPSQDKPSNKWLDLFWAFLIWGSSGAFLLGLDALLRLVLLAMHKKLPEVEITWSMAIIMLAVTLVMQLVALLASWAYVTRWWKKPFWRTLGWHWHPQFKWVHAVALAVLMYGLGIFLSKVLPHTETDVEKILKLGTLIRVMVAVLAVATAPLVEEIVYRSVVYSAVERISGKAAAIAAATFIFALVHVPQYWGSVAAITVIVSLSLVLTLLRAWTGSLLPCVATHMIYNGVQAVILLVAPDKMPDIAPPKTAMIILMQWLGLN
ncbi:MAG: CPBP family glutamic-type intramembrane protease [Acidobacteriota bacterium]